MKKAYLYCNPKSLNDATNYYVGIIEKALTRKNVSLVKTQDLAELADADIIVTITVKDFLRLSVRIERLRLFFGLKV